MATQRMDANAAVNKVRSVDELDLLNAFTAGYRHGRDVGLVSPREAQAILEGLGRPTSAASVDCFCNGAEDGARGDSFRYLLAKAVRG